MKPNVDLTEHRYFRTDKEDIFDNVFLINYLGRRMTYNEFLKIDTEEKLWGRKHYPTIRSYAFGLDVMKSNNSCEYCGNKLIPWRDGKYGRACKKCVNSWNNDSKSEKKIPWHRYEMKGINPLDLFNLR